MNELLQIEPASSEIIRVFPARTKWTPEDPLAFIGDPPFWRPGTVDTPVMVSVTFTWQRRRAEQIADSWRMYYRNVRVGGPAYQDPGGEFIPGRFLKKGCTITSRGCPKKCGWCNVPGAEGSLRELPIKPGWIVQDNNLLACSDSHIRAVFDMLRAQKRNVFFNGGLDKDFLKPWHRDMFDSVPIGELWFACDRGADLPRLEKVMKILDGIPQRKLRCYTMIGYDEESLPDAVRRLERVFELGFLPFCQLFQPPAPLVPTKIYSAEWKAVMKRWCRPAAMPNHAMSNHRQQPQEFASMP